MIQQWNHQAKEQMYYGSQYEINYPKPTKETKFGTRLTTRVSESDKGIIEPYEKLYTFKNITDEAIRSSTISLRDIAREEAFRQLSDKMSNIVNKPTIPLFLKQTKEIGTMEKHEYSLVLSNFKFHPYSQPISKWSDLKVPIKEADLSWTTKTKSIEILEGNDEHVEEEKQSILQEYYENIVRLAYNTNNIFIFYPTLKVSRDKVYPYSLETEKVIFDFDGSVYWLVS